MVKALFDTSILIDYLRGVEEARQEIARYDDRAISIVSWMEVMAGAAEADATAVRAFLAGFDLVALDQAVAEAAVDVRRTLGLKLPDAIVRASAVTQGRLLVTRDEKDFAGDDPGVRIPYRLPPGR
jgi:predicted nucleic acid-binding protein